MEESLVIRILVSVTLIKGRIKLIRIARYNVNTRKKSRIQIGYSKEIMREEDQTQHWRGLLDSGPLRLF